MRTALIICCLRFCAAFQEICRPVSAFRRSRLPPITFMVSLPSNEADSIPTADIKEAPENDGFSSWSNSWFPLAYTAFTDRKRPTQHYLLGAPIVVWYFDGAWHAMLDKCPHRLVPLSEGRIVPSTGDIECPYHGFTFEGTTGQCTRVPQAEPNATLIGLETRGCATALPCCVQQGILWVHAGPLFPETNIRTATPKDIERYKIEPLDRPGVLHADYFRDLPMDWSTLAENVLDPAHLPFTHHKTISSRSKAVPVPLRITEFSKQYGFKASRSTDPPGAVQFCPPQLIYSETVRPDSFTDWNVVHAIPTLPGRCRLLVRVVFEVSAMKPPLKYIFGIVFRQPNFLLHLNNHKILEDDNVFLHHQGHNYKQLEIMESSFKDGTYLPTSADVPVVAFHRWLNETSQDRKWSPHTPPGAILNQDHMLTTSELVDRKHSHTDHCTSCLEAKKWLERIEPVASVGAVLCAVRAFAGPRVRWPMGIVAGTLYALKRKVGQTRQNMKDGEWPPPRNR